MINLAGASDADDVCELELRRADIPFVIEPQKQNGEVSTRITGQLGPFTFRRAWYYWVVNGPMPMEAAREMYADPAGVKDVRVHGHCGCPAPDEWCKGGEVVRLYHIDSQEGLNLFARTARKYRLAT